MSIELRVLLTLMGLASGQANRPDDVYICMYVPELVLRPFVLVVISDDGGITFGHWNTNGQKALLVRSFAISN